ncbi:MAG: DUF4912 domain-containing protein [Clostridia bacterium]|nr:DUF4912 domain-containing protein [Clostridia bacterium]
MQLLKSEYYELPNKYNQTIIRLLVQSPTRMFVYWEVSDETIKLFADKSLDYANCTPALKITNVTKNYSYMIPVDPYTNNYYIEVEDSGCDYKVELGRCVKDNFINIYTSNKATVPNLHPLSQNSTDDILFANYLCISDKKRVKLFASKEHYRRFANQNHTEFEGNFSGSSDEFYN